MISELVQALIGVGSLLKQGSPSVIGVKPWCGGMLLAINGDGNCTGTSWMVCSLVWAAQAPRRLKYIVDWMKTAKRGGAFSNLSKTENVISPSIKCTRVSFNCTIFAVVSRLPRPVSRAPRLSVSSKTLMPPSLCFGCCSASIPVCHVIYGLEAAPFILWLPVACCMSPFIHLLHITCWRLPARPT